MQNISSSEPVFLNVEFIFSWLYSQVGFIFSIDFFRTLQNIATILVLLLIAFIFYCLIRLYEFKKEDEQKKIINNKTETINDISHLDSSQYNPVWESIRDRLLSDSHSDWRLAIIEADIYMDRLLDSKGFRGDTLGDKLKNITPDQLASIQVAWEAHKVRNRIAHDGSDFILTMPESRRVLSYFEIVFRDLGAIE